MTPRRTAGSPEASYLPPGKQTFRVKGARGDPTIVRSGRATGPTAYFNGSGVARASNVALETRTHSLKEPFLGLA
jgi:hypothetical protein